MKWFLSYLFLGIIHCYVFSYPSVLSINNHDEYFVIDLQYYKAMLTALPFLVGVIYFIFRDKPLNVKTQSIQLALFGVAIISSFAFWYQVNSIPKTSTDTIDPTNISGILNTILLPAKLSALFTILAVGFGIFNWVKSRL